MSSLVLLVLLGLAGLNLAAPAVPLEILLVFHLLVGSGRWANVPPVGLGLPLLTTTAVLTRFFTDRGISATRTPSRGAALGWTVVVFVSYLSLTLLWSPSRPYGAEKLFRLSVFCLLPAVVLVRAIESGHMTTASFLRALRWAVVCIAAIGVPSSLLSSTGGDVRSSALPGTDPIIFGLLCAVGLILWLRVVKEGEGARVLGAGLALLVCMTGLISSNSKGPIVGLALVGVTAYLVKGRTRTPWRRRIWIAAAFAGCFGVIFAMLSPQATSRLNPALYLKPGADEVTSSVSQRNAFRAEAIAGFERSPVFGLGMGSFNQTPVRLFGEERPIGGRSMTYPHNIVLEVAYESGALGLALLAAVGLLVVRSLVRQGNVCREAIYLAVLGFSIALFSNDLSDHRLLVFAVALGIAEGTAAGPATNRSRAPTLVLPVAAQAARSGL